MGQTGQWVRCGRKLVAAISLAFVVVPVAEAQDALRVGVAGYPSWEAAVAALQGDRQAQGSTIHVVVEDGTGARSPCRAHQLILDDHATRAFALGACDGATGATSLRLVDRAALFDHGDVVARPRSIGIAAIEVRRGAARGGARLPAETELACGITVRPYVVDLFDGRRVRASPDRFEVRPVDADVHVEPSSDGWSVRAGSVQASYELLDRSSGEVVLRETVRLRCERGRALDPPTAAPTVDPSLGVIPLTPGRVFHGTTITRGGPDHHASCGGREGPEQWYQVDLDRPTRLALRLVSEFDAILYLRAGSIDGQEIACRDETARLETLSLDLPPGRYFVAVDGSGTHGRYRLVSYQEPADPRALAPELRTFLPGRHSVVEERLRPAVSHYRGSCGGDLVAEHLHAFRVERPSVASFRLASHFDAALYVLDAHGVERGCRSTISRGEAVRRVRLGLELEPGLYYVVVDGESDRGGSGPYRLEHDQLPLR